MAEEGSDPAHEHRTKAERCGRVGDSGHQSGGIASGGIEEYQIGWRNIEVGQQQVDSYNDVLIGRPFSFVTIRMKVLRAASSSASPHTFFIALISDDGRSSARF
jgi:hypothetical protein